jgi:tryptophan synthase beta chain
MSDTVKYLLDETRLPKDWYNIVADLPRPPEPVLHPGTLQPVGPQDLEPLFPMALIQQEVSAERSIEIPEPVREVYRQWRPSPLYRARRLERALDTPARIYYKYEGVSPAGSHKPNTAVAQAFYNKDAGVKRLTTETGAGQWGSALAFAGAVFGLDVRVYMVRISFDQKPYRKAMMEAWGAQCVASPSGETNAGRRILAEHPNSPGSLGIAISEAVEVAAQHADTKYSLGSVLNHVLLHQTIIGQEAMAQLEMAGDYPDVIVGCTGGGSNFAGIAFPFIGAGLRGGPKPRVIACEPAACPSLTRGKYAYDFGDTGHLTPLVKTAYLGLDVRAARLPRRRIAVPWDGAAGKPAAGARAHRISRAGTEPLLRGGPPVLAHRRRPAGSRSQPRRARRDRRGVALQKGRHLADDPLQSVRPRSFRYAGLYRLPSR